MKATVIWAGLFCYILASCANDEHSAGKDRNDNDSLAEQVRKVLNDTKATKCLNPFDELGCEIYRTGPAIIEEPTNATIDYELGLSLIHI